MDKYVAMVREAFPDGLDKINGEDNEKWCDLLYKIFTSRLLDLHKSVMRVMQANPKNASMALVARTMFFEVTLPELEFFFELGLIPNGPRTVNIFAREAGKAVPHSVEDLLKVDPYLNMTWPEYFPDYFVTQTEQYSKSKETLDMNKELLKLFQELKDA